VDGAALQGVILAVGATVVEGVAQVFLKRAAIGSRKVLWTALGLAMFAVEALVYTVALRFLAVSVAYPIGALSFVAVTLLSQLWLRERVDRTRWCGIMLIILGAALVATRA